MLSADKQEEIIRANRGAFEELARRWRDPQTGSLRPDLKQAVINMVRDYFGAPGCSTGQLLELISDLYDAAEEDDRLPIELTDENQIPDQVRAVLKRLGPDDDTPPAGLPIGFGMMGRGPGSFWCATRRRMSIVDTSQLSP